MTPKIFIPGPILPGFITDSISKHTSKTTLGGHELFLGQARADQKNIRKKAAPKCLQTCLHIEALAFVVDETKNEVTIFDKEIFEDHPHTWKINT